MAPRVSGRQPAVTEGFPCYWPLPLNGNRSTTGGWRASAAPLPTTPSSRPPIYQRLSRLGSSEPIPHQRGAVQPEVELARHVRSDAHLQDLQPHRHMAAHPRVRGGARLGSLLDRRVDQAIAAIAGQRPVYSAAYIMPPPRSASGPKYTRHLELIRRMVSGGAPGRSSQRVIWPPRSLFCAVTTPSETSSPTSSLPTSTTLLTSHSPRQSSSCPARCPQRASQVLL